MLEKYRSQVYKCTRCGDCRDKFTDREPFVCPAREHTGGFEPYYARGRIQVARGILEGRLRYTARLGEALYSCFCCGNCEKTCKGGIEAVAITRAMRADLIGAGLKPPAGMEQIASNIARTHNLFGAAEEDRAWEEVGQPSGDQGLLYFPGCVVRYWLPELARSTTQIVRSAGLRLATLGREEWCCGNPLLLAGEIDLAEETVRHNSALLRSTGMSRIVTSCPGCYRTLKQDYFQGGVNSMILHVAELIRDLVEEGAIRLTSPIQERVAYHDPCELGRRGGVFEAPREVMSKIKGLNLIEMPRNREEALCCGGGGGVKASNPSLARRVCLERLDEARKLGVSKMVSCCPSCKMSFEEAIADSSIPLEVLDLTELVARAIGISPR